MATGANLVRNPAVGVTPATLVAAPCELYGFLFLNPNAYPVYVKFFDALEGDVTVGTTVPFYTMLIPAVGWIGQDDIVAYQLRFNVALTVAITKNIGDADATALDANCICQLLEQ